MRSDPRQTGQARLGHQRGFHQTHVCVSLRASADPTEHHLTQTGPHSLCLHSGERNRSRAQCFKMPYIGHAANDERPSGCCNPLRMLQERLETRQVARIVSKKKTVLDVTDHQSGSKLHHSDVDPGAAARNLQMHSGRWISRVDGEKREHLSLLVRRPITSDDSVQDVIINDGKSRRRRLHMYNGLGKDFREPHLRIGGLTHDLPRDAPALQIPAHEIHTLLEQRHPPGGDLAIDTVPSAHRPSRDHRHHHGCAARP